MKKAGCLALLVASGFAAVAVAENLFPNPGFETWDDASGFPTDGKYRWSKQSSKNKDKEGKEHPSVFERDTSEKFSGEASLHIVDPAGDNSNSSMGYTLRGGEVAKVRGKTLYFACRVKQKVANSYEGVGISLDVKQKGKYWNSRRDLVGVCGSTPWMTLRVSCDIPEDTENIRAVFQCAAGFNRTGEAWYDDVVLTTDPAELPPWVVVPPDELGHADWAPPMSTNDTPEEAAYREELRRDVKPYEKDGHDRPEIKNGTWFWRGKYDYFLGPWISSRTDLDWYGEAGPDPLKTGHIAYLKPPSKEVFDAIGFNSAQISSARAEPGRALRGIELTRRKAAWRHWEKDWKNFENHAVGYFKNFEDVPLVMDFAFGYNGAYPKDERKIVNQYNSRWHSFIPFCPEHPEGKRYYYNYYIGGTIDALRHGGNIFIYELINESSYNCQCPWNIAKFVKLVKKGYGTIEKANSVWGTSFDSFDAVYNGAPFDRREYAGVWRDWCAFTSRRYVAFLRENIATIRAVDKRDRVYFTEQSNGTPPEKQGMDYRLIGNAMDVLSLEGGFRYGSNTVYNAADDAEEVVASAGSRHFFNCDFFQALAKGKKPIMNNEHYCGRLENGERVLSKRSDYLTSLWLEVMHGVSGNYTFAYKKHQWDWHTEEQAKAYGLKPSWKSHLLLIPFNHAPKDLDVFKEFQAELEPFKSKLLPFPRVKPATVAIHYSQASMVQRNNLPTVKEREPTWSNNRGSTTARWHAALLHAFYPIKVVFDEDLADLGEDVEVLALPDTRCVSDRVIAAVRAAKKRGVKVVIGPSVFGWDEYLKARPESDADGFVSAETGTEAVKLLNEWKVRRYVTIEETGTARLCGADAQVCDRGAFKLVCIANRAGFVPCPVRVKFAHLRGKADVLFTLRDEVLKRDIPGPTKGKWTLGDLAKGVELTLPPEERVILTLTAAK